MFVSRSYKSSSAEIETGREREVCQVRVEMTEAHERERAALETLAKMAGFGLINRIKDPVRLFSDKLSECSRQRREEHSFLT